ncbi:MAG TPA: HAMP domain-containing sensor histidine kinase, partial [Aquella sp.]|nr:HAMP domain-containing sensor histidine kinase [Aquella sp.]
EAQNKLNKIILEKEAAESERLRLENALHKLENDKQKAILEEQEKFRKFVGQIVHDIKSPLASLRGVVNESGSAIPEEKRITLRKASMRISDIAQHMLSRYKNEFDEGELAEPLLVSAAMLEVIGEKRYEHSTVNFDTDFKSQADFAFIRVESGQFKRMISNLLNNAVEALEGKPDEKISLRLNTNAQWIIITIRDNGKGISKELVDKIKGDLPVTEGKKHGSGIGLTQVREAVQRNFGKFEIYSTLGQGTSIILRFPKILPPAWIAEEVKIIKGDTIVILDDDKSIHGAWDLQLKPILSKLPNKLEVKHFTEGMDAINFINSFSTREKNKICLLTDYELLNQDINGLQVVEQTKIKRSILVTSHYANLAIRDRSSNLGIKILPKDLAFAISINLDQKVKPGSKKVDMVCVDDDLGFVQDYVERFFSHLKIDMYSDPDVFLENIEQYPLDTKIILDHFYSRDWGPKAKYVGDGVEVAIKLNKKGFTKLVMLTGEEPDPDSIPPYLTVILKDDDEKIKNLVNL